MNLTPENATDAPITSVATERPLLDHERLDCYAVALEFAGLVPALTHGARSSLRDQLERASASICLNIAEAKCSQCLQERTAF